VVEHDLAKVGVEGSNPFARSKVLLSSPKTWVTNVPKTWVTTSGRTVVERLQGSLLQVEVSEIVMTEADEPDGFVDFLDADLMPRLWPASAVEMLIFLR
jgi:hypothetical protein